MTKKRTKGFGPRKPLFGLQPQGLGHALPVRGVRPHQMPDHPLLDVLWHFGQAARHVLDEALLLVRPHQPEEVAWLHEIVIGYGLIVAVRVTGETQGWVLEGSIRDWPAEAVGLVVHFPAAVAVHTHEAVPLVVAHLSCLGAIDRDLLVVHPEPVAVRVRVGEYARLQHLVRREGYPRDDVGGREGRLLHLREIVVRVAVELQDPYVDAWVVIVRPDLGEVEGVPAI